MTELLTMSGRIYVALVEGGPMHRDDVCQAVSLSESSVDKYLQGLRRAGLVESIRSGQTYSWVALGVAGVPVADRMEGREVLWQSVTVPSQYGHTPQ